MCTESNIVLHQLQTTSELYPKGDPSRQALNFAQITLCLCHYFCYFSSLFIIFLVLLFFPIFFLLYLFFTFLFSFYFSFILFSYFFHSFSFLVLFCHFLLFLSLIVSFPSLLL